MLNGTKTYTGLDLDKIEEIEPTILIFHNSTEGNVAVVPALGEAFQITVTHGLGTPGRSWVVTETGVEIVN